jgi:hypothetical protein
VTDPNCDGRECSRANKQGQSAAVEAKLKQQGTAPRHLRLLDRGTHVEQEADLAFERPRAAGEEGLESRERPVLVPEAAAEAKGCKARLDEPPMGGDQKRAVVPRETTEWTDDRVDAEIGDRMPADQPGALDSIVTRQPADGSRRRQLAGRGPWQRNCLQGECGAGKHDRQHRRARPRGEDEAATAGPAGSRLRGRLDRCQGA